MDRACVVVAVEQVVQLIVQRADAFHQRDVLRDTREVPVRRRIVERVGEVAGDLVEARNGSVAVHSRPQHWDEPAGEQRLHDLGVVILDRPRSVGRRGKHRLLAEDVAVQLLKLRAGIDPELLREREAARVVDVERLGLTAGAIESKHQLTTQPLS